jgi:riboflavin kinase / FMN adenylyltransferase
VSQEGIGPKLKAPSVKGLSWNEVQRQKPCIAALGNFDGVHLGHHRILDTLLSESKASGLDPVLITFEPHPRYYFKPQDKPSLLSTPWEKVQLLKSWPIEVVLLDFDQALADLEPEDFIQAFLQNRLKAERFLLGHDHRYGKRARGDVNLVRSYVANPDRDVLIVEPFRLEGEVVSSSAIRNHLEASRIDKANFLLGRPFSYSGRVVPGDGRGRGLGFPTANLEIHYPYKAMVEYGVYGGKAKVQGREYAAITNIGKTPTFPGQTQKIEVHILDHDLDLYGEWVEFELHFHVRPEKKFASIEALRSQISLDIAETRTRL